MSTTAYATSASRKGLDPAVARFLEELESSSPEATSAARLDTARIEMHSVEGPGVELPAVDIEEAQIVGTVLGPVRLRVFRPPGAVGWLPGIVYLHGGGWVFGDEETHAWVLRSLAIEANAAVVFVEYHRSPEARFPVALEESYSALEWLAEHGGRVGVDGQRLALVGDSAGANMATVTCMLTRQRGGPHVTCQVLFYPLTDATHGYPSFETYGTGFYLSAQGLRWSRSQYLPDRRTWTHPTASPLRAEMNALRQLPPTLLITAELDPLRDEGEAYARRLMEAGVPVVATRYVGMVHAFLTLRALAQSSAPRAAIVQAGRVLRDAFNVGTGDGP